MRELTIRAACDADLPGILQLLRESMGRDDDPRFESLFRWKHLENAYGRSPMWLALDGDRIAGLRVFMRWEFERAGSVFRAVRAVDTATHPDFQGQGIFTRLTMHGLDEVAAEGVDFVFNTPNTKSRPGYLKMGWHDVGRAPAAIRPLHIARLPALRRARTAAAHWSEPIRAGVAVEEVLAEIGAISALLAARPVATQLRTRTTPETLAWRFGLADLRYRAVVGPGGIEGGVAFVRVRRRGPTREGVVALVLAPDRPGARRRLGRAVTRALRPEADHLLALDRPPGFVPLAQLGPIVTARPVTSPAPAAVADLALTLGDVELF